MENRINETKTGKFRGGVRLRTFEDNYRRADSILRSPLPAEGEARCRSKFLFKVAARSSRRCRGCDKNAVKLRNLRERASVRTEMICCGNKTSSPARAL